MNNSKHYFTDNAPEVSDEKSFVLRFKGAELSFASGAGTFSHGEADPNSLLLMREVSPTKKSRLLDLGCGYGLIGVTLCKVSGCSVTMSDINGGALFYAEKNAARNGVSCDIVKSDGFENISGFFDIITLNPPIHAGKAVCVKLFSEAANHLTDGGSFYTVIMDKHGMKCYEKILSGLFCSVKIIKRQNGTNVIICKNSYS